MCGGWGYGVHATLTLVYLDVALQIEQVLVAMHGRVQALEGHAAVRADADADADADDATS